VITSELVFCPGVDVTLDGLKLPFAAADLQAIVMTNVFHHLSQPHQFLGEAARCISVGGVVVMIEPWVTPWSRLIYTRLHHEPFHPDADSWDFSGNGPLSGANGALPYIIFARDRPQFEQEFPMWHIQTIKPLMPFCYLVSGGVSLRNLMPGFTFRLWQGLETILYPWLDQLAMFALIILERVDA
jgi:SAM-dependent methyltransferase